MNIPGYRIERELAHGGMATVYLAVQESLDRQVALKVMAPALAADRTFGERFLKEARTVARLNHPHILAVHDVGVEGHNYYLAMELVPGGDLKQRIREQAVAPKDALQIVRQIAQALGYAHDKGFVHRDVKPENVLFREDGTAVLSDFGIAKAVGSGTRTTGTGMSIGTPHYMSPEQARGQQVDGRSDLYSLGILLYEMLTGRVPFEAEDSLAIGIKHITEVPDPLPARVGKLQSLLDGMLCKNPGDRFASAGEVVCAIDTLLRGEKLTPSGRWQLGLDQPSSQKHSGLVWGVSGAIAALALVGGVVLFQQHQTRPHSLSGGGGGGPLVGSSVSSRKVPSPVLPTPTKPVVRPQPMSAGPSALAPESTEPKVAELSPLERLRKKAAEALAAKRLTQPENDCALGYFGQMLGYDGGRQDAIRGLANIGRRYLAWAKKALGKAQFDKCKTYLERFDQAAEALVRADPATAAPLKMERDAINRDRLTRLSVPKKKEPIANDVVSNWQQAINQRQNTTTAKPVESNPDHSLRQQWQRAIQQHSSN